MHAVYVMAIFMRGILLWQPIAGAAPSWTGEMRSKLHLPPWLGNYES